MLNLPSIPIQDVVEARNELLALMSRLAQRSLFGMATVNIAGYPDGFWVRTGLGGKGQKWHGFRPIFKRLFPENDGLIPGATTAEVYNLVWSASVDLEDFYAHVEQARILCDLYHHRMANPDDYHPVTRGIWPFQNVAEACAVPVEPNNNSYPEGSEALQQREDFSEIAWSFSVLSDALKTYWGPGQPLFHRTDDTHDILIVVPVLPFPVKLTFALPKAVRSVSRCGAVPTPGAVMRLVLSSLGSMEGFFQRYDSLVESIEP